MTGLVLAMLAATRQTRQAVETTGGWVKYAGNPVLGSALGTCFDVCVLKESGRFRMWFSWRPKASIAVVESRDGIRWSLPVIALSPNPDTEWEADINRPVVLKRGGMYHMWYTGQARGHSSIGYATSVDGRVWKRMSAKPVLIADTDWERAAVMCPHVLWDGGANRYRMWYSGGEQNEPNAIGHAVSADGLTWEKDAGNPIFRPDASNMWERDRVTGCQVFREGGWYQMLYIGFQDESFARIGLARSRDGLRDWQRHPLNPLIGCRTDSRAAWDYDAVYKPYALLDTGRWLLYYNGRRGGMEQIGLAIHKGRDLWSGTPGASRIHTSERERLPAPGR